jgi:hypothetical protein
LHEHITDNVHHCNFSTQEREFIKLTGITNYTNPFHSNASTGNALLHPTKILKSPKMCYVSNLLNTVSKIHTFFVSLWSSSSLWSWSAGSLANVLCHHFFLEDFQTLYEAHVHSKWSLFRKSA